MENGLINDFINEIAISLDENYIQKLLQNYLEYKGLIDPKNVFDIFKFDARLASPINMEDYKELMDKLQADYVAKGPTEKPLEEILNAIPNKVSISSYELLKNTSFENANYEHRAFKFSIAVMGANLYAVLNILYDLAKKKDYRFNFELPSLNLQKSGMTDKITIYSDIANIGNTLNFLNEALPLIEPLTAVSPSYKNSYKGIYSVDTCENPMAQGEKVWLEELIGKTILEAIDETIIYISNKGNNIQIEGNILIDYFNNAKNKLIARRKIIKDIKERYIANVKAMLINTTQNRLQSKGVNLSNGFLSQEVEKLLTAYLEEKKNIENKEFTSIDVKKPTIEIDEKQTESNPIADGLPQIQTVSIGHPKYFVNREFDITKEKQEEIDWKNLDVNMEDYGKADSKEEAIEEPEEQKKEVQDQVLENIPNETVEDKVIEEEISLELLEDQKEMKQGEQTIDPQDTLKNSFPQIGKYDFIKGYPDELEKMVLDEKTGQNISLYDYFEREHLLDLFPQDFFVNSSVANLQNMKTTDFINNYLLREIELKGTVDLKNYMKDYDLKIVATPTIQKAEEKVYKSNPMEAYNFIKGYPQTLSKTIVENSNNVVFKMNLYSYFEKEHLLDLFPRNSIVSGDTFDNLKAEDFINEHLLRYLELYGPFNLDAYIKGHHIVVKEQINTLPNAEYLKQLESEKEDYTNRFSKYVYLFQENPKVLEDKILDFDGNPISLFDYFEREGLLKFFPKGAILSNVNYEGPMTSEMFINNVLIPYLRVNGAVDFQEFIETQQWNVEMMNEKKKGIFGRFFK